MKKLLKQFSAGFLAIALVFSAIPPIQASAVTEETAPAITGLTMEDMSVVEGKNAWENETEDGTVWYEYRVKNYDYAIELSDGSYLTRDELDENGFSDYEEFYYDGVHYYIRYQPDQSAETPWKAGNTYEVPVTLYVYDEWYGDWEDGEEPVPVCDSTTFNYTIIENPIEKITFQPLEVVEYTHGSWDHDWIYDEETDTESKTDEYYIYDDFANWFYTVEFKDGTTLEHDYDYEESGFYYEGEYYELDYYANQSYNNQWKKGTHKVTVRVGTYETTYDFIITESPVADVKVHDVTFIEKNGGYYAISTYWDDEDEPVDVKWYSYYLESDSIDYTVVLKNGEEVKPNLYGAVVIDEEEFYPSIDTDQSYDNQWGVGTHKATFSILGKVKTINVTILCDHVWDKGTTTAATCTSKGDVTYKCTKKGCNETKTTSTPASNHKWNTNFTIDKEATCSAAGSKSIHCANCNATKDATVIPAKGHTPGAAATCTAPQTCTVCQAMLAAPTGHTAGPEATCTTAQNCAKCGAELAKVKGHAVALKTIAKANAEENGEIVETCICGQVMNTTVISQIANVKMPKAAYAYTGEAVTPGVTVKNKAGVVLTEGTDYDVTYKNNNKVGKATATVKFKGDYSGSKKLTYTINPAKPTIKNPVAGKKSLTAKWSKVSKQATGYEVMIATDKKFSKNKKTVIVKSFKTTSKKISKLKSKKIYYVKVRTYKTVGKVKYYSDWSAVKKVKVK